MQTENKTKCELCNMDSTHAEFDTKNKEHHFCEHHNLSNLKTNKGENKYKKLLPLFFVFLAIILISSIRQFNGLDPMLFMMDFMGVFFIVFGLFKLVDLNGFAVGFKQYDPLAKSFDFYGYIYPFLEIFLGVLYLMGFMFLWQNMLVLFLSGLGIYSAYKYIDHKDEIRCVCLGTLFDLPMTWVTLSENLIMFIMVIFMLQM